MREVAPEPEMGARSAKYGANGGDYVPVEQAPGRAVIARRGIAPALTELVEEGWLSPADAMDLTVRCNTVWTIFMAYPAFEALNTIPWVRGNT